MIAVDKAKETKQASCEETCQCFGLHRDAYYKYKKRHAARLEVEKQVIELVKHERIEQPRMGTRKLLMTLHISFNLLGLKVGRDELYRILRKYDMLVGRKKSSCKTTDSYHHFHKYANLIKNLEITKPNQVWVSDITYIKTYYGFCYLALITDLYSRKIVGYDISNSLELTGCLRALKAAIKTHKPLKGLIHHSDRGAQYCSKEYVKVLKNNKCLISMTEENHCYENAVAERVNGILKDEFYLDQSFASLNEAKKATKNAVNIYNNKRLHLSLDYKTPDQVFSNVA
jgi:transposase InsO family protein